MMKSAQKVRFEPIPCSCSWLASPWVWRWTWPWCFVGFDTGFLAQSVAKTPDGVGQPKGDEGPGGEIAAASLDALDLAHRHSEANPEATEDDR